ncbi:MAG TPA: hypothetical protein VK541_02235 [Pedobacter sp.]|uniref:hypothetical protein n=1 Tax=Pedobacter sp. TaxID=1411316 RepID=UPI002D045171|nr:hypothetical protein [Pedobacter sp.]HMI01269.1 hypothetical protein [Pedobacter sp.]
MESTEVYYYISKAINNKDSIGGHIISQFFHNNWYGLRFWDLIQPAFMFMTGVAMTYSLTKQIEQGKQRETAVKTNGYWLSYLNTRLQNGEDFNLMKNYDSLLNKISPASLKAAAQKYLSGENYIRLVLMPEKMK